MVKPKALVLDLDGTTLNANGRLSPADVAAAHALKAAGIAVTIATGRLFTGTQWVAEALGVEGTVAVMNGSEVVHVGTGTSSVGWYFNAAIRSLLREALRGQGLSTFLFGSRRIHYDVVDARHAPLLSIWTETMQSHISLFDDVAWDLEDLLAVGVTGEEGAIRALHQDLAPQLPHDVEGIVFSAVPGEAFLKLRHSHVDKGTALHRLAMDRGFTASDCVAVGDWWNDVPMLRTAGRSFAMAHANERVKAEAHDVLDSSRDGGAVAEVARLVWGITA